jgi:hypothetical protein
VAQPPGFFLPRAIEIFSLFFGDTGRPHVISQGGYVGALTNQRDDRVEWVPHALENLMELLLIVLVLVLLFGGGGFWGYRRWR